MNKHFPKHGCKAILVLAVLLLSTGVALGDAAADVLALSVKNHEAALQYVAALTGNQITTLANGKSIPLDNLSEAAKAQIMQATKSSSAGHSNLHNILEDLPAGTKLGLEIKEEGVLKLANARFGDGGTVRIELSRYLPAPRTPQAGPAGNPPDFASMTKDLPADMNDRHVRLRELMRTVLSPIALSQLGGRGIPFEVGALEKGITVSVPSATAEQSKWLGRLYEAYRKDAMARQKLLKDYEIENGQPAPSTALLVDVKSGQSACTGNTPSSTLPPWNDIADGTSARLYAEYFFYVKVISGCQSCGKGIGWAVLSADPSPWAE